MVPILMVLIFMFIYSTRENCGLDNYILFLKLIQHCLLSLSTHITSENDPVAFYQMNIPQNV